MRALSNVAVAAAVVLTTPTLTLSAWGFGWWSSLSGHGFSCSIFRSMNVDTVSLWWSSLSGHGFSCSMNVDTVSLWRSSLSGHGFLTLTLSAWGFWSSSLSGHGFSRSMDFDTVGLGPLVVEPVWSRLLAAWTLTLSASGCRWSLSAWTLTLSAWRCILFHVLATRTFGTCRLTACGWTLTLSAWCSSLSGHGFSRSKDFDTVSFRPPWWSLAAWTFTLPAWRCVLFHVLGAGTFGTYRLTACCWTLILSACAACCCMRWSLFVGTFVLSLLRASACAAACLFSQYGL